MRSGAEPVDPRLLEPHRARLGEVPDDAQRRQVVAQADVLGEPPDPLHHRRHEVDDVGPVGFDGGERRLGVEALEQHDVAAAQQRLARPHRRTVVVQRAGHHEAAVRRQAERRRAHRGRSATGRRRRSAWGGPSSRPTSAPSTPARRRRAAARRRDRPATGSRRAGTRRPSSAARLGADDDLRAGEADDLGELARRQLGRHRLRHGAELPAGDVGDEPVDRVRQGDGDEVTRS